jgi:nicotinamidase/pyrazinamidase
MKALILVDIQNDFCLNGALAVKNGDEVVAVANQLNMAMIFDYVVLTQDWHPKSHKSFASNNKDAKVGELGSLNGNPQIWWPDHCVWGEKGAEFHKDLLTGRANLILRKGMDPEVDSYSGFHDNAGKPSGLGEWLKANKVKEVYIMGLATDYCIKYTALGSVSSGFTTYLVEDGCRAVQPEGGVNAIAIMRKEGVKITNSKKLLKQI